MQLAVGSDEKTGLLEELRKRDQVVKVCGPMTGEQTGWPEVGEKIGVDVSSGRGRAGDCFLLDWDGSVHCGEQGSGCSCGILLGRWAVGGRLLQLVSLCCQTWNGLFFSVNFVPKNTVFLGFQQSEDRR